MRDLLTTRQVAALLNVKAETVQKWRERGVGPAYVRLGEGKKPTIRYRQADIDRYICEKPNR